MLQGSTRIYGQDLSAMSLSACACGINRSQHCYDASGNQMYPLLTHIDENLLSAVAAWPGIEDRVVIIVICHETEKLVVKGVYGTGE